MRETYGLSFREQRQFQSTFMYRAVASGDVDVISAFSTDGRIAAYDLVVLDDPQQAILPYDAIVLLSPARANDSALKGVLQPLIGAIPIDGCAQPTSSSIATRTSCRRSRLPRGSRSPLSCTDARKDQRTRRSARAAEQSPPRRQAFTILAEQAQLAALVARVPRGAAARAVRGGRYRHRDLVARGELDLSGRPQAVRAVLSRQRHALQDARRNLGRVRAHLPQALDRG